jgi:hypothetical protein
MNDAGIAAVTDHDESVECMRLARLLQSQFGKRMVTFPKLVVDEEIMETPPIDITDGPTLDIEIQV